MLTIAYVARGVLVISTFSSFFAYLIDSVIRFLQRHSLIFQKPEGPSRGGGLSLLVLVGHSWGALLGFYVVARRPDLFYAFVGTGQPVSQALTG